jgi:hypothetical protein
MTEERWEPIEGYENYSVSDHGNVRREGGFVVGESGLLEEIEERMLRQGTAKEGVYRRVSLVKGSTTRRFSVHRLVATAFCFRSPGENIVRHIDHDRENNFYSNLCWAIKKTDFSGGENNNAKLSAGEVEEIRERWNSLDRKRGLGALMAREYGVSKATISGVVRRANWK